MELQKLQQRVNLEADLTLTIKPSFKRDGEWLIHLERGYDIAYSKRVSPDSLEDELKFIRVLLECELI